ncbi:P-loop containing nucleoside triphosphate hydrolase protein [Wallemia mellicola]|nr:P-loop containing nucleoside triphosphate hydrolase protein [Wallemia mellicola]TIC74600.1 P-loop containing nucleoside triphosphate hydrolase protein [Wallemia mellicola]
MDDNLYDEFGNYLGDDLDSDEDIQEEEQQPPAAQTSYAPLEGYEDDDDNENLDVSNEQRISTLMQVDEAPQNQVVLHEDKRYYPSAEETYGPDVETRVEEEDAQHISEPIVQPIKERKFQIEEKDLLETRFDRNFLVDMMHYPEMVRNVVVVGHLHHGKTSLMDLLTFQTHKLTWDSDKKERYTDLHELERSREISIKSTPMSFVLQSTIGKSILVNAIDTPGHTNFVDEVANATRLADGAIVVVDVVEGVMAGTELALKHVLKEGLRPVLVLNKMERLFLELRLPPSEAYFKVKHTIEEVNSVISTIAPHESSRLSPELGNVAFASTDMHWCFTLQSFAQMYADTFGSFDINAFAARLWGNIFFDVERRKFVRKPPQGSPVRSFVHFVLEPLYKIYTQVIGEDVNDLAQTLAGLGISLKPSAYKMDTRPLLKLCLEQFFGPSTGLVDMLIEHIPSAKDGNATKVDRYYTGPLDSPLATSMLTCDSTAPSVIHVTKLYTTVDAEGFYAFGRVMAGRARIGDEVKVLGEGFSADDEEDMAMATIQNVWVSEARYKFECPEIPAGSWVLLGGVDESIVKTATIVSNDIKEDLYIFRPINHISESILKVAVEPLNPPELPRLLDGLRKVNKSYPLLTTKVEESGEHIILGTGELYLDSVLHDLRTLFSEIEIKVSDPVVKFCETVVETSAIRCYADTPNKKNKITIIAEPLEKGISEDIENRRVGMWMTNKERGKYFEEKYGWDTLASRSIWTFGPEDNGPNVLIDDTLPSEVDKKMLGNVKESIKQGFQWATREGPLADEQALRGVKFRIMDAQIAQEPIYRGGGQVIPTSRRVCYSSFLMATPRLMEPIYYVEIITTAESVPTVYQILARRRGHVTKDEPKAGSPLYVVKALIPAIDANGFETDLRTQTGGTSFCLQIFDHWAIVPGDPVDSGIQLRLLEPAPAQHLARDFMLKIRRRKGLGDGQNLMAKYLDDEFVMAIVAAGKSDLLF